VATQDLAGHLLHLLGVEGRALPEALRHRLGQRDTIYGETRMPLTAYGWSPLRALTTERYRYVAAPRPEIYDLLADPAETRNLAGDAAHAATVAELRDQVLRWFVETSDVIPQARDPRMEPALVQQFLPGA
jgi:arylsulfatase A-like enzyme